MSEIKQYSSYDRAIGVSMEMRRPVLYRHFDANGRLLYVGTTRNPMARLDHHFCKTPWIYDVETIKLQYFDSDEDAKIAERKAILSENPAHNIRRSRIK